MLVLSSLSVTIIPPITKPKGGLLLCYIKLLEVNTVCSLIGPSPSSPGWQNPSREGRGTGHQRACVHGGGGENKDSPVNIFPGAGLPILTDYVRSRSYYRSEMTWTSILVGCVMEGCGWGGWGGWCGGAGRVRVDEVKSDLNPQVKNGKHFRMFCIVLVLYFMRGTSIHLSYANDSNAKNSIVMLRIIHHY